MPQPPLDETWELQWAEADHCIISSTSEQQWCTPLFLCLFLLLLCVVDVVILFCCVSLLLVVVCFCGIEQVFYSLGMEHLP